MFKVTPNIINFFDSCLPRITPIQKNMEVKATTTPISPEPKRIQQQYHQWKNNSSLKTSNVKYANYEPHPDISKEKSPAYTIHGKVRDVFKPNVTGPGQYEIKSQFEGNPKGYNFGKDKKDLNYGSNIPGPNTYQYEQAIKKFKSSQNPKFSFGSKPESIYKNDIPGPGQYERKEKGYSKIGGIISRDMNLSREQQKVMQENAMLKQNPGPGSYQTDQFYSKEWSRGSGKYSLGKSGRNQNFTQNPGPGSYDYQNIKRGKVCSTFGKEQRLKLDNKNIPGPGSYSEKTAFSQLPEKHSLSNY